MQLSLLYTNKALLLTVLFFHQVNQAQSRYDSLWNDPAIEQRISKGIEQYRKGECIIQLPAYKGTSEIDVKQVKHDFQFGANAFMVKGFENRERNTRYEAGFASLFNMASVPFYWKTLEPEPGKLRFDTGSTAIYRRPPPDAVLNFCKQYGITPKGHTLIWNHPVHSIPEWLPKDTAAIKKLISKRIEMIGRRYGSAIHTWDVVNEALKDFPEVTLPKDYVLDAFKTARKTFPASTEFMINEVTGVWLNNQGSKAPYYELIQHLLARGAAIRGIGLQFHFFNEQLHQDVVAGKLMTPRQLLDILDLYAAFKLPLQISEITIPTLPFNEQGMQDQARLTRNFYRLWFSHPSVEAIIWWNLVDGTALKGEDKWNGGLLNNDFSAKPSHTVLNELINKEWKTDFTKTLHNETSLSFRGFYGSYRIRIKQGKTIREQIINFTKDHQTIRIK